MALEIFYANQDQANSYLHVNEGDKCIAGLNGAGRIYFTKDFTINGETLKLNTEVGQNNKICLFPNNPSQGLLEFHPDVKGNLLPNGEREPLIITNVEGQFNAQRDSASSSGISIVTLGSALELTGKYDPVRQTGHPDFRGIFHPLGWAYAKDRMGIRVHNRWQAGALNLSLSVQGPDRRLWVDCIAVGEGGFTGLTIKTELSGKVLTYQEIVDLYDFHELKFFNSICYSTDSEPLYLGSTQSPAHKFENVYIENVSYLYGGTEDMQLGHMGKNTTIKNVTIFAPNMWRFNPFQQSQDKGMQAGFRTGNITIDKFIIDGGGSNSVILFNDGQYPDASRIDELPFKMSDGYIGRGMNYAMYMNNADGGVANFGELPTPLHFENLHLGGFDDSYNLIEPFGNVVRDTYFRLDNFHSPKLFRGITYETGRVNFLIGGDPSLVTIENENPVPSVPNPIYNNSGFGDLDPRNICHWFARMGESAPGWNAQHITNQTAPFDVAESSVTIGTTVSITAVSLPKAPFNASIDVYTKWIGRDLRVYDKANPYDNFAVHEILSVNTSTLVVELGPAKYVNNGGAYFDVAADKEESFLKFDIDQVVKDHSGLNYGFFKYIGTGDRYLSAGRKPYDSPAHWEQMFWEGNPEPPDDYTQAVESPYYGWGIYNPEDEEPEPPPPGNIEGKENPRKIARKRLLNAVMSRF